MILSANQNKNCPWQPYFLPDQEEKRTISRWLTNVIPAKFGSNWSDTFTEIKNADKK